MGEKIKKGLSIASNILNGISSVIIFFGLITSKIEVFLSASITYLLACGLKLIANKKDDKKLIFAGIVLIIFTIITGAFNISNMIKWNLK